ncbi:MAG: biotin--[acetyl-CoA-carboxylase] ligase [Chloroflexi bacterium]|nr:biotin--[acetyl-CoA-carboxylase] ligase [Chloroflexota bacterium]
MNQSSLQKLLAPLALGGLRYFESIGSTNDEALAWATENALDFSLVIADEQTTGRGRAGRRWVTPRATALAFSVILRPFHTERSEQRVENSKEVIAPTLFTGLGAVALTDALKVRGLFPQIKWPNDILLNGKKVAGILTEAVWTGDALDAIIIGMGVNALAGSNPSDDELFFPATNLEAELGRAVQREDLLRDILSAMHAWREKISTGELIQAWEENLAFRGEQVRIERDNEEPLLGQVMGLEADGSLRLSVNDKIVTVQFGEIHLRPAV